MKEVDRAERRRLATASREMEGDSVVERTREDSPSVDRLASTVIAETEHIWYS